MNATEATWVLTALHLRQVLVNGVEASEGPAREELQAALERLDATDRELTAHFEATR